MYERSVAMHPICVRKYPSSTNSLDVHRKRRVGNALCGQCFVAACNQCNLLAGGQSAITAEICSINPFHKVVISCFTLFAEEG